MPPLPTPRSDPASEPSPPSGPARRPEEKPSTVIVSPPQLPLGRNQRNVAVGYPVSPDPNRARGDRDSSGT